MEPFLLIFIFFGVIAITALLFGAWVVFWIIRLVLRGIIAMIVPAPTLPPAPQGTPGGAVQSGVRCANVKCRHVNPGIAHFCRRCGAGLPAVQRVATRRVAMW